MNGTALSYSLLSVNAGILAAVIRVSNEITHSDEIAPFVILIFVCVVAAIAAGIFTELSKRATSDGQDK